MDKILKTLVLLLLLSSQSFFAQQTTNTIQELEHQQAEIQMQKKLNDNYKMLDDKIYQLKKEQKISKQKRRTSHNLKAI
ncbi:hypothetical protein [Flavobacterium sp. LHD-85]|uniref:hypothetical protein n=1 Tax=Flavobacterium sp. LHD-85 TaxID=3071410 RepID=UPI0027E1915B|nr:hypothetical protein [Flavobacterium sp. LHD-85]MDQ6528617.1 hypothetical protein [Flavobacterium sp. LHD-85]